MEKQLYYFAFPFSRGQLSKERICSSRSKFFPLRVDPFKKATLCGKQEFTQVNITLFSKKKQGRLFEQWRL